MLRVPPLPKEDRGRIVLNEQASYGRRRRNADATTSLEQRCYLPLPAFPFTLRAMPSPIRKRMGARLPHWTSDGATYAVAFRLADSIPEDARFKLSRQLEALEKALKRGQQLALQEQVRLHRLRSEKIDEYMDAGHGECLMKDPAIAEIVAGALMYFHGQRYRMEAWCVMPNHVHAVVAPLTGFELPKIIHSWKNFTAHEINKALGRGGSVWQREYYDHICRDQADLMHHVWYTLENPAKAGLSNWKWLGCPMRPSLLE